MRSSLRMWSLALCIAFVAAIAASPADAMSNKEQAALDKANREWRGANCRSRLQIVVKKPKKKEWSKCEWIYYSEKRGNEHVRIIVSDGAAVHRAFYGGAIPPGTEFKALGWSAEKGGNKLYLELELVGHPVRVRVFYCDDWVGLVSVKRLEDFERWAKYDFLDVISVPSEQLVDVPTGGGPGHLPPAVPPSSEPATSAAAAAGPPSVEIVAVAVQPARVTAGSSTDLVINYTLRGVPAGPGFEVVEVREIYLGEQRIAGFEEQLRRGNGTHPSRQPLQVPAGTAPGVYTLKAKVVAAGREVSGTALFEVTAP